MTEKKRGRPRMKRPGYREALEWLAGNDDCYWLADDEPMLSVAAALVCDLFDVSDKRLQRDLRRALARVYPDHEALRGQRAAMRAAP